MKVVSPDYNMQHMLEMEISLLITLRHPSIVRFYGYVSIQDQKYIVMELCLRYLFFHLLVIFKLFTSLLRALEDATFSLENLTYIRIAKEIAQVILQLSNRDVDIYTPKISSTEI